MPSLADMVVVDEAELVAPARGDRDVPGRAGAGRGRRTRHPPARPTGDRPRRRRRPRHPGRGLGPLRAGVLGQRRPRGCASRPTPPASRGCNGPGTSPTSSDVRSRWRTSESPRVASATRCAPSSRPCSSPPRKAGTVLRGTADMYVGMSQIACERGDLDAATAAPAAQPGARRARRAAAEPVPVAGRDGPSPGGPGRSGRRAQPARRGAAGVPGRLLPERSAGPGAAGTRAGRARPTSAKPSAGPGSTACPRTTTSTYVARVRAHHPGQGAPGAAYAPTVTRAPCSTLRDCWSACCRPPRRAAERAASSRSWCCRRSPTMPAATPPAHWRRWNGR